MNRAIRWALCAGAIAAMASAASAATLTVDDVVNLEAVEGVDISPDGSQFVWAKRAPSKKHNLKIPHIYITAFSGGQTRQLTRGDQGDRSPMFSPSGRQVAFLSKRDKGETQLYVLDLRGGEARAVTKSSTGVDNYAWLDDSTILYTAREDSTLRERRLTEEKDDTQVVADKEFYPAVRLFRCDIEKGTTKRVTENTGQITEFALSPDKRWVVTSENQDVDFNYNNRIPPKQFLVDMQTGARQEICTAPYVDPYAFRWDADSDGFYCAQQIASDSSKTFVSIRQLFYFDISARELREVPLDWDNGLGRDFLALGSGALVALYDGMKDRFVYVDRDGDSFRVRSVATGKPTRLAAAQRGGDRVIVLQSTATSIPEVIGARLSGNRLADANRVVDLNEDLKKKTLATAEIIRFAGARGDTVEGIVYYPVGYDPTRTYPLMTWLHGGPSSSDPDFFTERVSSYPNLLAGRGVMILKVNYHGSDGYGLEWLESIKGRYYEYEMADITAGIDYLIGRGMADPERLGIMGWSNGAILAIQACIESDRFKVLCAGAGDVNWTSDYGNCAFGAGFDDAYFGGAPWEVTDHYVDKSPLFKMEQLTTPTLIMFGDKDTSVPTEQGWQHFRAMREIGQAPVRFLLFPGAGHGPRKLSHLRRKMNEDLAWIDRYLLNTYQAPDNVLAPNSVLAMELQKSKVKHVGFLVGDEVDASVVPEVVTAAGLEVGRFEVTRAQFAAFDPNYGIAPGTDNMPVSAVSIGSAQAYCLWLSEKMGATYRLPTEDEMKRLLATAEENAKHENTLDYWIGYTPTPEEFAELRGQIDALEKRRPLLEPVGSFRPTEDGVYDLGGNAAEWVTDADGNGKIRGRSAVSLVGDPLGEMRPPLTYVGFRVIRVR